MSELVFFDYKIDYDEEGFGALHLGIVINLPNGSRFHSTQKPKVRCT